MIWHIDWTNLAILLGVDLLVLVAFVFTHTRLFPAFWIAMLIVGVVSGPIIPVYHR